MVLDQFTAEIVTKNADQEGTDIRNSVDKCYVTDYCYNALNFFPSETKIYKIIKEIISDLKLRFFLGTNPDSQLR